MDEIDSRDCLKGVKRCISPINDLVVSHIVENTCSLSFSSLLSFLPFIGFIKSHFMDNCIVETIFMVPYGILPQFQG